MKRNLVTVGLALLALAWDCAEGASTPALDPGWANPPPQARLRAYWWWLNGNVTKAAISRDLKEMKAKGFGGAVIVDAGGAEQWGNDRVPHGPTFFSPEWRDLYKHALREASRLGLEISLNIQSGWNLGGPMVAPEDTVKKLTWSETTIDLPESAGIKLPAPSAADGYYRDYCVLGWRVSTNLPARVSGRLRDYEVKAMIRRPSFDGTQGWFLANSAPDTARFLLDDLPAHPGEEDVRLGEVVDFTPDVSSNGVLISATGTGRWKVLRFGVTLADSRRVSTCSDGWNGYALDVLDQGALRRYWDAVVEPLISDAGPLAGKTLRYLHTDSWEVDAFNWTPTLPEEFRLRRGYDLKPWLPVVAGYLLNSRPESRRFLDDLRRTLGDLAADNHYRLLSQLAARRGLGIHCESGGPHFTPVDAQQCLGLDDIPMSEFWARSATHRSVEETRFFVKQPASAAHTMGRRFVAAEGFTSIGPHWQETLWDNLKPSFDQALCEGMNLLVWHAFVCSPPEMGIPGQQYFAGTHFNPNTTWWPMSEAFLAYLNRCQFLLQAGQFDADVCYYYGDHVPNYAQLKRSDPARVQPGYDYDVISQEALLTRMSVREGRLALPDGMSYRILVLPNRPIISLPVLRKVKELAAAGATVIGLPPTEAGGLKDYPRCDAEVAALAAELWGPQPVGPAPPIDRAYGKGRVISGKTAREVLLAGGIQPDFECLDPPPPGSLDFLHRSDAGAEIYFVANRSNRWLDARCAFRVSGKAPEIWDPVSGDHTFASACQAVEGRTTLPLRFSPYGSRFVVFRSSSAKHPATGAANYPELDARQELSGAWTASFDPVWGGPASVQFDQLLSWTARPEPGIKYYSGMAAYAKTFDLAGEPPKGRRLWLDLGDVRELAQVRLNGKELGIVWAPPFRVEITGAAKAAGNRLEVQVVNFWPNRIIGDQSLPAERRYTRTNIRRLTQATPLMVSGLLGPVRILTQR